MNLRFYRHSLQRVFKVQRPYESLSSRYGVEEKKIRKCSDVLCPPAEKRSWKKKPYCRDGPFFAPPPFTSGVICVVHKKRFEFLVLGHLEPSVKIRETLPDSQGKILLVCRKTLFTTKSVKSVKKIGGIKKE